MANKSKVLAYAYGRRIIYGHSHWTAKIRTYYEGKVLKVTPNGGVLVLGRPHTTPNTPWVKEWIPYNWIVSD